MSVCRALERRRQINTLAWQRRLLAARSQDSLPSDLGVVRRAIAEAAEREQVNARSSRESAADRRLAR
jgi:hypothetical protein